jgi:hypothetical protein
MMLTCVTPAPNCRKPGGTTPVDLALQPTLRRAHSREHVPVEVRNSMVSFRAQTTSATAGVTSWLHRPTGEPFLPVARRRPGRRRQSQLGDRRRTSRPNPRSRHRVGRRREAGLRGARYELQILGYAIGTGSATSAGIRPALRCNQHRGANPRRSAGTVSGWAVIAGGRHVLGFTNVLDPCPRRQVTSSPRDRERRLLRRGGRGATRRAGTAVPPTRPGDPGRVEGHRAVPGRRADANRASYQSGEAYGAEGHNVSAASAGPRLRAGPVARLRVSYERPGDADRPKIWSAVFVCPPAADQQTYPFDCCRPEQRDAGR